MLKTLIKIRLQGILLRQTKHSKKSSGSSAGKIVLMVLLFGYVAVVFSMMFGMLFSALVEPLQFMQIEWLYFAIMGLLIIMLCFIGSVFIVQHEIYEAKDNNILLSMPIKNRDILLSRVFVVLILNYVYEILVAGPAAFIYITQVGMDPMQIIAFILVVLTLPLFVLAVSCLFSWALTHVMRHIRMKNLITLVMFIGFFAVYMYAISSVQEYIGLLIQNGKSIAQAIEQSVYPLYHMAIAINDANIVSLLIYLVCALIPFGIVMVILSKSFIKLATAKPKTRKIEYVEKPMKANSMLVALIQREVKHFTSSAMVMLNAAMGIIMCLIATGALIIYQGDIVGILGLMPSEIEDMITPILCIAGIAVGSLNIISASSISLEGDRLWIIKALPIPVKDILNSKMLMHFLLCVPFGIIFSITEIIIFKVGFIDALLVIISPVLFTLAIDLLGLVLNLWKPKFDWVNETACVKQSMPVMLTMFISMGLVFVLASGYFAIDSFLSLNAYMYFVIGVIIVVNILLYYLLMTWGIKRFQEL